MADTSGANRPLVYVLGTCGLRFGEVAELRWHGVEFDNLRLRVSRSVTLARGAFVVGSPKNGKARTVSLPAFVAGLLVLGDPHERTAATTGVRRCLAILQHAEEVTSNVATTCRYYGISRRVYYRWLRRYQEQGIDGMGDLSRRPHDCPAATHVDVVGKIFYLRQNYHFGPGKIAMYLKRYHDVEVSQCGVWRILNGQTPYERLRQKT